MRLDVRESTLQTSGLSTPHYSINSKSSDLLERSMLYEQIKRFLPFPRRVNLEARFKAWYCLGLRVNLILLDAHLFLWRTSKRKELVSCFLWRPPSLAVPRDLCVYLFCSFVDVHVFIHEANLHIIIGSLWGVWCFEWEWPPQAPIWVFAPLSVELFRND